MIKILLGSLLVVSVLAFSSGNFTEPANASVYEDTKIRVVVSIDQATSVATFFAKFKAYGYFSLLFSTSMSSVRAILFRATTTTSKSVHRS